MTMWLELLVGGVTAVVAVQDSADVDRGERFTIPPVRVEVPGMEIEIPPVEIEIPRIDLHDIAMVWTGFDFHMPGLDLHMPSFEIDIPGMRFDVMGHGWRHRGRHGSAYEYRPLEAGDLIGVGAQDTDTVFDVDAGARLEVKNHAGSITVEAWDRDQIRVRARHSRRDGIRVNRTRGMVELQSESRGFGPPSMVDYELTVPASMELRLHGPFTDVSVTGARNGVSAETVQGFITLRDCEGVITLHSIEGLIEITACEGRIEATTVDEDIRISDTGGQIYAETIDGEIHLDRIRSRDVEARTVDGDVFYRGPIEDDGRYRFTTHDGDVVVSVPEGTNATISVATFDGELIADFPIEVQEVETRRRFSFTLGNGRARVELQSFDGDIRLQRPHP